MVRRLGDERGQVVPALAGLLVAVVALAARPRRVWRRRHRRRARPAGRRSRGAVGRSIDARRLRAPVRARPAAGWRARTPCTSRSSLPDRAGAAGARRPSATICRPRGLEIEFPDADSFAPLRAGRSRAADRRRRRPRGAGGVDAEAEAAPPAPLGAGGAGRRWRPAAATPARLRTARARHAPRRCRGLRRDGGGRGGGRRRPDRQLRLSLRRRAGGALRRQPGPALGRAAGHLAAPLRHRARPRPADRLRLAGRQRARASASSSATRGSRGTTASRAGPAPCSAAGDRVGRPASDGDGWRRSSGGPACPPSSRRASGTRSRAAASRWNVSGGAARRPADGRVELQPVRGLARRRRGIAQFMPATAAAYGLDDPFDPVASIDAQAHLMSDLLRQFGDVRARPRRLQRRCRRRSRPAAACRHTRRPRPTSPASSACSTAREIGVAAAGARGELVG